MRKLLGILLILFAIYTPFSLFLNIPPFNTNEERFEYQSTYTANLVPFQIYPEIDSKIVITSRKLDNPEQFSLTFIRSKPDISNSPWYYITPVLFVASIVSGLSLLLYKS